MHAAGAPKARTAHVLKLAGRSVLVTGGAGFIGSHLVDRIVAEDPANLVVVDNLFLGKERNLDGARRAFPRLRFFREDVGNYEAMAAILASEQIEVVFDLAVIPLPTSLERPRWTVDTNVTAATTICELLRAGEFSTLIHFSSSEVYGTARYVPMDEEHPLVPSTPYAASKAAADHVVLSYGHTFGVDVAVVRPFNTFGPRQNEGAYAGVIPIVIQRALRGEPVVVFGDGEQTRDFTFVADVAEAAVGVYEEPSTRGRVTNVASGKEVTVNALIDELLDVMEVDVPIVHRAARPGDVRRHCGSAAVAEQLIGFRPDESLRQGLTETVRWYSDAFSSPSARVG